jgi:hypothetical protein
MTDLPAIPLVPVSWGEVIDKITILEIKRDRIANPLKRSNILRELGQLSRLAQPARAITALAPLTFLLKAVNRDLWEIEDAIRLEEAAGRFGPAFIALARAVYQRNDERAGINREINDLLGSGLVEEKSYAGTASPLRPASSSAARHSAL